MQTENGLPNAPNNLNITSRKVDLSQAEMTVNWDVSHGGGYDLIGYELQYFLQEDPKWVGVAVKKTRCVMKYVWPESCLSPLLTPNPNPHPS